MRVVWVLWALFLCSCGLRKVDPYEQTHWPIINGYQCSPSEFPSSIEIWMDAWIDMAPLGVRHVVAPICGGTLIRPDVILTAAHCLREADITQGFGKIQELHFLVDSVESSGWTIHGEADIGLLFLQRSLLNPVAQLLQAGEREHVKLGAKVNIVGWGQQTIDSDQEEDSEKVNHKMCAQTIIHELRVLDMQVGSDEQSPRQCYGDSGGAAYLTLPNGEIRLIGIASHSYGSDGCTKGGIDTRVDPYLDWINKQLDGRIEHGL